MSLSEAESSANSSDTTAKSRPKKRCNPHTKPAEEKLAERLSRELTDELAKIVQRDASSDLLDRLTSLQNVYGTTTTTTTTTTTSTVATTTTAEVKTTTTKQFSGPAAASEKPDFAKTHQIVSFQYLTGSKPDNRTIKPKYKKGGNVFTLDDFSAVAALERLVNQFGKVSHMGILDKSYSFFVTERRDAALYFKVKNKVAVVGGDPLCDETKFDRVLAEFAKYRKMFGWGISFLGATSAFATYAQRKKWVTMQFGVERVLNPMTNPLLLEKGGGKRIISQSKQLLRSGITLGIYSPKHSFDSVLQDQLLNIYETWCSHRNEKPVLQAYMTVYDPFAMPELMTYVHVKDASGEPCGFAALRKIVDGYHIDPCIALPGSPRGISELLIVSTMSLLRKAGISYLSLGFEPSTQLGAITGMAKPVQAMTRSIHRRTYRDLPIGGKKDFHDKFRPDEAQEADLYIVFPGRSMPGIKHMKAMMHIVNIDISRLVMEDMKKAMTWRSGKRSKGIVDDEKKETAKEEAVRGGVSSSDG